MTEFVKVSRVDFIAKDFLVSFREVPEIFQEQDDLRRKGNRFFIRKFRPGK